MLWIKRNLFLAVGGLVAALLLGAGIFYFITAKAKSDRLEEEISQTINNLNGLYNAPVFPGVTNVTRAREETEKLRAATKRMRGLFTPVAAEKVTGIEFRRYRDNTLSELQEMARLAGTTLPSKAYAFSFTAQKDKVDFKERTFPGIPEQMAEVKALSKVLFDSHVDPLVNIRRARVSRDDEESTTATDYNFLKIETNALSGAVISPYELAFNCLSSDLALVLQGLMSSPHGFVVKVIHIEPAPEAIGANPPPGGVTPVGQPSATPGTSTGGAAPVRRPPPPGQPAPGQPGPRPGGPAVSPGGARPGLSDKPVVLLKERRLKVTMLVHVIKFIK